MQEGKEKSLMNLLTQQFSKNNVFGLPIPAQRILVLAPHPDDEILGCGGTILSYYYSHAEITIVYMTDGRFGIRELDTNTRKLEAQSILKHLPNIHQIFLDFADSQLYKYANDVKIELEKIIVSSNPDIIFTPWVIDRHSDHEATTVLLAEILDYKKLEIVVSMYEIMLPLFCNHTVNISKHYDEKKLLLNKYTSQVKRYNLENISATLNSYRAALIRRKGICSAEAFFVLNTKDLVEIIKKLFIKK